MARIFAAIAFIAGLAPAIALADAQAYLCIADQAVGFRYDKNPKAWKSTLFSVKDERYILKLEDKHWHWSKLGSSFEGTCNDFTTADTIGCVGTDEVLFNRTTLRYQLYYPFGYIAQMTLESFEGSDTPYIEIGRCSEM